MFISVGTFHKLFQLESSKLTAINLLFTWLLAWIFLLTKQTDFHWIQDPKQKKKKKIRTVKN